MTELQLNQLRSTLQTRSKIDALNVQAMALQAQMIAFQTHNAQNGQQYPETTFFAIETQLKKIAEEMQAYLVGM